MVTKFRERVIAANNRPSGAPIIEDQAEAAHTLLWASWRPSTLTVYQTWPLVPTEPLRTLPPARFLERVGVHPALKGGRR